MEDYVTWITMTIVGNMEWPVIGNKAKHIYIFFMSSMPTSGADPGFRGGGGGGGGGGGAW